MGCAKDYIRRAGSGVLLLGEVLSQGLPIGGAAGNSKSALSHHGRQGAERAS